MSIDGVYLDYAATAPLRSEAREAWSRVARTAWGNPSSVHRWGREARAVLEDARTRLGALLGAEPREIVFTRGGTEADNMAVLGRGGATGAGQRVAASAIEHRAVLHAVAAAEAAGRPATRIPADGHGRVEAAAVGTHLDPPPALVSVMWVNNETGVVQPVEEIGARCREAGVVFHTDAVQALGKVPVRVDRTAVDLLSLSAHKIGGPRGVGALFVRRGTRLAPVLHGGGQEGGLRPGTEDVAGAAAFAAAAEAAEAEREGEMRRLGALRADLEAGLRERIPGLRINGEGAPRVATIANLSLPGADPELLLAGLDLAGIAASSGSACSSGSVQPSHVLLAMGLPPELAGPSLRLSLGRETTAAHIQRLIGVLPGLVERLRGG